MRIQASSTAPTAKERYFASVEERATVVCFLDDQVIKLFPRNTRKPIVEQRSTGLPAQSASVKAMRDIGPG
jgi:hypothetical protein